MILPITAYGDPVLRKMGQDIDADYPELQELISSMYDTMYHASGVGLAAPQIGKAIRLFVVDASPFADEEPALEGFKKTFINAQILEETGTPFKFNEGCLSIPGIREDVFRRPSVTIRYQDEQFQTHEDTYTGLAARIIQHEYDHIQGVLFVDHISPLRKKMIKSKLEKISKGEAKADYRLRFFLPKRR